MLSDQFLRIVDSFVSGDSFKISEFIEIYLKKNLINPSPSLSITELKEEIEGTYYQALADFLALRQFEKFRRLFDYSDKLEIFIDVKKIPNRFKIISDLHLEGMQIGQIGAIFEVIRIYNEYNLFNRDFTDKELKILKDIKKNKTLISNLEDLFGNVTDSLIWYSCKIMPYDLYLAYLNNNPDYPNQEFLIRNYYDISFLKNFFDYYSIYGLSVQKLGHIKNFIQVLHKNYLNPANDPSNKDLNIIEFRYKGRKHLVSLNNIRRNYDKILDYKNNYNFYSLSMVLLGGLGPQGLGFTYSTPRGEVVEICSDRRENRAIIIKYKEFLKQQFLKEFKKELIEKNIEDNKVKKIIDYLTDILNPKELINYYKKGTILTQIKILFDNNQEKYFKNEAEFKEVMKKVSNSIGIILRPIEMVDQFKCRMDMVEKDEIKSEEIAKLTSLKGKSHYDVLRERFFFQNEIKWFFKDYNNEISKIRRIF
ncbi:MAG: hypothetical protein ACFFAN_02820 [Promethearchaeota archaeon]